uniref:Uncharacterized protein n=1 Tax=Rhizophora mucronata TaxID=61149 RepID=A0A2P2NNU7_RHIMU
MNQSGLIYWLPFMRLEIFLVLVMIHQP